GGMRTGMLMVVIGPGGGGKSEFMRRLAQANGVMDTHAMNSGGSDQFSLMRRRPDGQYVGCLLLNGPEPATDKERADMENAPGARNAFLTRWFKRTHEVLHESGGIFVISVRGTPLTDATWAKIPDYIVSADQAAYRVLKSA
ncbi:MAG: hypothetical protein ABIP55_09525, partial [Tepidisphaeraceae bacterium]